MFGNQMEFAEAQDHTKIPAGKLLNISMGSFSHQNVCSGLHHFLEELKYYLHTEINIVDENRVFWLVFF